MYNVTKILTAEERAELRRSPYVASITCDRVLFTDEFKELAYQELLKGEKTMRQILQDYGINTVILGSSRIHCFAKNLRLRAKGVSKHSSKVDASPKFTAEEREKLRHSPYVASVLNNCKVEFTLEFKKLAYQELLKEEKTMREIFQEYGIDPEILGNRRIWGFTSKLRKRVKSGKSFEGTTPHYNGGRKPIYCKETEDQKDLCILMRRDLRNNPYVADVKNDNIQFTEQFQDLVAREFLKEEKSVREILQDYGFDIQLLGASRIAGFTTKIRKRCKQLRESQHDVRIVSEDYNVSTKENEETIISMDKKHSYEGCTELISQSQTSEQTSEMNNVSQKKPNQKLFTEEERSSLLNNPYVSSVTNDSVQFTEEFKELAYREFLQGGKTMRKIFQEHDIDPEILGSKRIWNFTSKLQEKAKKSQGFGDARQHNKRRPAVTPTEEKALTARVRDLEHELAYTRQEIEFLKKTQMADMEARILWESKQDQKKNLR